MRVTWDCESRVLDLQGTYRKGMNLDDPFDENDPVVVAHKKKVAAAKAKKERHCEFCGLQGHSTTRAKKCMATAGDPKKYRVDGSLLSEVSPEVQKDQDANALLDCDLMDSMPFDAQYESEQDEPTPFFDEEVDSDDDDSRPVVAAVRTTGQI
jgi:hypothetical protein